MPYPDLIPDFQIEELRRRLGVDNANRILDNPIGESVFDRVPTVTSTAQSSQALAVCGFTALATQNINRIQVTTAGTAAGATPTLCRLGVYLRNQTDNTYSLVASTANDTSLFSATGTTYTVNFSTGFLKVAGQDYLAGILIVTAAALPTFNAYGNQVSAAYSTNSLLTFPQLSGRLTGQADLPASFAGSALVTSASAAHILLLQ